MVGFVRADGEQLFAPSAGILGADRGDLGRGKSHLRFAGDTAGEKGQRVEYRVTAADINPYVAMAAALASGLRGIERKIEPDPPVVGNGYEATVKDARRFPGDIGGSGNAASQQRGGAGMVWRGFYESLRRLTRMGRAAIPRANHGLGIGAVFRDYLSGDAIWRRGFFSA